MASKLILLFAVLALASVVVLAGPEDKQSDTSCSRFSTSALQSQIQACARFISPTWYSFPGEYCARDVAEYLDEHNDCSTVTITEVVSQCLINQSVYGDERQKTVNCVELSLTSGVCC
ncbi:Protein RecA [Frankliniella fusca]|uniref:Protein RecA n=1 Tax=Frankliniella fusca TaxID=407009 RepID=A0AAE1LKZ9_9NEOP|nr:Protein RecA [Frankliniella fusca]